MSEQKRRIFISDIHMGIEECLVGPHPYGWLSVDRARMLTEFIESLKGDNAVDELIIVGDLFDQWLMPFSVKSPVEGDGSWFARIAKAPENAKILAALSNLANRASVSYVQGNHDMQLTKNILERHAPGVKWIPGAPGMGAYVNDGIHAEHGSLYCLFNAPYFLSADKQQHMPIGYFMARSDAQFVSQGGALDWDDYLKMFFDIAMDMLTGEKLAQALLTGMSDVMGIKPDDAVHLYGVDHFASETTKIDEMANLLGNIYDEWDDEWKKLGVPNVSALTAYIGDTGHLHPASRINFSPSTNLVVYGHTHKWELTGVTIEDVDSFGLEMEDFFMEKLRLNEVKKMIMEITNLYDPGDELFEGHVYANSGAWIDGAGDGAEPLPATYVDVIDGGGVRTIHMMEYGVADPLKTRKIRLG
ncbi:MAG: hypothetical protein GY859_21930 [Desulfobacterales bacterium]|nr:hypothetical protein [Desulfobacterales bacterium]